MAGTAAGSRRERVALDDASWLQMDSRTNPMVVNVQLDLAGRFDRDRVAELFASRVVDRFPRFEQRVAPRHVGLLATPHWEVDPEFELDRHIVVVANDPDDRAVATAISDLAGHRFDPSHPRWSLHLLDRSHGSSILLRTHHAMADGLGLVQLLYALADPPPGGGLHPGQLGVLSHRPRRWPALPPTTAGFRTARVYRKLATLSEQRNPLRAPLSGHKQLAMSGPVDLARAKGVLEGSGATINDLGLAVLAGALRRYLSARVDASELPSRVGVTIPFNLRPLDRPLTSALGNQIGLVFVNLPLDIDDPARRLSHVRARTSAVKASPEGEVVRSGMAMVGALTHRPSAQAWMRLFTRRSTAIVTNIAGPPIQLAIDGVGIEHVMLWVPTSGSVGLGLSLVTYAGSLRVGVYADTGVVSEVDALCRAIDDELADLTRYRAG